VQVLTALEFGGEEKREKSSRLLEHIILASQSLIKPYVAQVLAALYITMMCMAATSHLYISIVYWN
jgi:hypothetical protein